MAMQSPIPHDLTNYRFDSNNDPFDFERNGFCSHQWEISMPQKNCIIWDTVLSYLKSTDFAVQGEFEERLNRLTENAFDTELVKAAILDYNPFFNIHKCFFDETLQRVSQTFRRVLNENRPPGAAKTVAADVQLISTLLKSNILIVDLGRKELHLVTPSDGNSAYGAAMTFICREYWNKEGKKPVLMKRFTFSLSKDLCWELRVEALRKYLESSDIRDVVENEIQQLNERKEKKINILIALLKKNLTDVISELYDSSYIVAKLAGAGFETDPRLLYEKKFSAFYYALQSNDTNLVYILYRHAANDCYESSNTVRDPNNCITSNLSKLKEILEGDCAKSNNFEEFGDRAEQARVTYHDLLRFNEFLIQVCCGIIDIRKQPDGNSFEEAAKQKEIILHILDQYDAFFSVGQLDSIRISEEELIENYTRHKIYYDNLDFTVALLFFDNIFRLKSILKSPKERLYSDLESIFVLSVIANKYFSTDAKKWIKIQEFDSYLIFNKLFIIPILERLNLREEVKYFCSVLRSKVLVEEDIRERIPPEEIDEMLNNFPKLKDELLIDCLDHYLKTALETVPNGFKHKIAIQRALQMIGESIDVERADSSSIRYLLRKSLPDDALEVLKKARNTLLHLKSYQFNLKFEAEQDSNLFASIQSEIGNIKKAFQKAFDIQRIRSKEFLIHRALESLQKFLQNKRIAIHPLVQPMENYEKELRKNILDLEFDQKMKDENCVVSDIHEFCLRLNGFASRKVKKEILDEVPPEVRTRVIAAKKLEQDLETGIPVTSDRFDSLFLEKKDLGSIKKEYTKYLQGAEAESNATSQISNLLHKIKKTANPLDTLDLIFDKKKVSDSQLKYLYEIIPFSEQGMGMLNSLIKVSKNPRGDNLENLLNRIKHLYRIAIEEQYDIRFLWERAKNPKAKQHLVYKIVLRYFRETSFQAAFEMLLFDCFSILSIIEDFRSFWIEDPRLFNGIDIRNVSAYPLMKSIGDILDFKDLPFQLVKQLLQLIEDLECIEALCDLWQKEKRSDKISDNSSEWCKLKESVVRCPRWEGYFKLLAEDPEIRDNMVSFLKNAERTNHKTE